MTLELPRETWGERVHRAYRLGREQYGYTYKEVAKEITKAGWPVSEQTLFRIEKLPAVPKTARGRMNAWLFLTALGFDPTDFQVHAPMGDAFDSDAIKKKLDPAGWMRHTAPSSVRSRWSSPSGAGTTVRAGATTG